MMLTASEEMAQQGTEGKYVWMRPKEGLLTWVCGLTISPSTKEMGTWEKAHDLINAYIAPESQHYELMNWGYGVANSEGLRIRGRDRGLPDTRSASACRSTSILSNGAFSAHQKRYGEIVNLYDEILAGM